MSADLLIRHHEVPRNKLYVLDQKNCPIPLKYVDVRRLTETDSEYQGEAKIADEWNIPGGAKRLSATTWTGRTSFHFRRVPPRKGHYWVEGRETRIKAGTRPGHIILEMLPRMSDLQQAEAIKE